DPLRLEIELPDVGLDRGRGRVRVDVEPGGARGRSRTPSGGGGGTRSRSTCPAPPSRRRWSRPPKLYSRSLVSTRDELPDGALRVQGPGEGLVQLRPGQAPAPGRADAAAVTDVPT